MMVFLYRRFLVKDVNSAAFDGVVIGAKVGEEWCANHQVIQSAKPNSSSH